MNNDAIIQLTDKVVLIAGAVGGQGQSHAQLLYQLGARLVLADIGQGDSHLLATSLGGNIMGLDHDVCSSKDWVRVVDAAVGAWGRIDVLVNNSGIAPVGPSSMSPRPPESRVTAIAHPTSPPNGHCVRSANPLPANTPSTAFGSTLSAPGL